MANDAYKSAVDYIHSLGESEWKLGLERFQSFCDRLGNPQDSLRVVHVAGTNGKGSTTAMIAAILSKAGYRVGEYLSPFVYDIRERFRLNGEMIPPQTLVRLVDEIRPHAESLAGTEHGHPTEFEMKTAIALLWFAQEHTDFAILEVGLGGRLDATNVVSPLVSVITNIGLDHTDRLGSTLSEIASEKAGIIKQDVPVVTAAWESEALHVIKRVSGERHAPLWQVRSDNGPYDFAVFPVDTIRKCDFRRSMTLGEAELSGGRVFNYRGINTRLSGVRVGMRGSFQLVNGATALAAVELLGGQGVNVTESAMRAGLETAYLPGRMEVIRSCPTVVLDGAHNPAAAAQLADELLNNFEYENLTLVMGMVSGHSIEGVVGTLAPLAKRFIATRPDNRRAVPARDVAEIARRFCDHVSIIEPVAAAVHASLEGVSSRDIICITGSFYTVGEVPRNIVSA